MKVRTLIAVAFGLVLSTNMAEARRYHRHHHHHSYHHHHRHYASYDRGSIVSHPAGCPRSLFCGCGASVRIFGRPIRDLFLAANWLRFPRTSPAPGMVAARRGHVFVLEHPLGDGRWQVYDANSGHGATRIHARSLAGYAIVNPHAG